MSLAERARAAKAADDELRAANAAVDAAAWRGLAQEAIMRRAEKFGVELAAADLEEDGPLGKKDYVARIKVTDDATLEIRFERSHPTLKYSTYGGRVDEAHCERHDNGTMVGYIVCWVIPHPQLYYDLGPELQTLEDARKAGRGFSHGCYGLDGYSMMLPVATLEEVGDRLRRIEKARETWARKHLHP